MRTGLVVLWMFFCSITAADAQVSVAIGLPGANIGINVPAYPQMVLVPGYPVYYAPQVNSNYFFYDGMYWVYQQDNWYASSWYNGPWNVVGPEAVPLFILRVPVRYYRQPPAYFAGWSSTAPPRWGDHWGSAWTQNRTGWDNWNHGSVPAAAPLPAYQRQYTGNRYPQAAQQQALQSQNYRYRPQNAVAAAAPQHAAGQPAQHAAAQHAAAAKPPAQRVAPIAQSHEQKPQQAVAQHSGTAPRTAAKPRPQEKATQQAKAPAPELHAQRQQQVQHAATPREAPHEQSAAKTQATEKGPQARAPAQEPKQSQEQGREQGEQRVAEHHD
jgi:hypothetical protein